MHARVSGTVDFREPDDHACLQRLRSLVALLDDSRLPPEEEADAASQPAPERDATELYDLVPGDGHGQYDARDLLRCVVDAGSLQEYKAEYGTAVVTAFARIAGHALGVVANQRIQTVTASGELQIGGVLYADSVEKAARFVEDCNQTRLPLVFLQDVQGFMVGQRAEQSGIIRAGAKLVNAVSRSTVPKFTVVVGGSFGAGNYALCGKAYDPWLIVAWPCARYAVMGADQAAATLLDLKVRDAQRSGQPLSDTDRQRLRDELRQRYQQQTDIRYGAARGWVDAIIAPDETRAWLSECLRLLPRHGDGMLADTLRV